VVQLNWAKAADGSWHRVDQVDPGQLDANGVFVVWRSGSGSKVSNVLYVGRGSLKKEFARSRQDPALRAEELCVTWATVPDTKKLDPIGAYLYQQLRPMWGEVVPLVTPVPVNLPITP
jgi:hypothetical protein